MTLKNQKVEIRTITKADILKFNNGEPYSNSLRGLAVERDGELLAIAGVMHSAYLQVFSSMTDEMRKYPIMILKTAKRLLQIMESYNQPLYALASDDEPTSEQFLKHLGFELFNINEDGRYFVWHRH
jgi:hypothetical protein